MSRRYTYPVYHTWMLSVSTFPTQIFPTLLPEFPLSAKLLDTFPNGRFLSSDSGGSLWIAWILSRRRIRCNRWIGIKGEGHLWPTEIPSFFGIRLGGNTLNPRRFRNGLKSEKRAGSWCFFSIEKQPEKYQKNKCISLATKYWGIMMVYVKQVEH